LRTVYKRKTESLDHIIPLTQNFSIEHAIDYKIIVEAIKRLSPAKQEAIILFEISGFSIQEIADIQSTNINTVKTRLARGREELKELLTAPKEKTSHGKF